MVLQGGCKIQDGGITPKTTEKTRKKSKTKQVKDL